MAELQGAKSSAESPALRQLAERQTKILDRITNLEQSLRDLGSSLTHRAVTNMGSLAGPVKLQSPPFVSNSKQQTTDSPSIVNIGDITDTLNQTKAGSIVQTSNPSEKESTAGADPNHSAQSQNVPPSDHANGLQLESATSDDAPKATTSKEANDSGQFTQPAFGGDQAATQQRLEKVSLSLGCQSVRFKAVPGDYYERSLEERRDLLGAPSIEHLCKSIVLTNTQAPPEITDCSNPRCSKYYLVVVQYVAKLNTEKVRNFVYGLNDGKLPKKRINMRLAPSEVSDALTGYSHNSVTPFGMKTDIPVILSDAIPKLEPPFFWLGAGEVNLKLGLDVSEFVEAVKPFIVDCT